MTGTTNAPQWDAAIQPRRLDGAGVREHQKRPHGVRWLFLNLLVFMVLPVLAAGLICGLAGRWDLWNVWVYAGSLVVFVLILTLGNYRTRPDLLQERLKPATRGRVRVPSSVAGPIGLIVQWLVAGLDQRFHWSDGVPVPGVVIGLVIVALGFALFLSAALVNPFFSSVTRVQKDRGQYVISAGPYRLVRHPAYASLLLGGVVGGLALNSLLSIIPILAIALPPTLYQLVVEDRMLRDGLPGYAEYAARVRYRLVPGIW